VYCYICMNYTRPGGIALIAWLAAMPAFSAGTLSWEDCRKAALEHDPDYLSAKSTAGAAKASYGGSIAGLLPSVGLGGSLNDRQNQAMNARWSSSLSVNMDILNFSDWMSIRRSAASLDAARASLRQASAQARRSVRTAFASLLYAQELVRSSEEIAAIRDRNAKLVTLRYEAGRELPGDKLQVEAQLMEATASLSQARRNLMTARMALARYIGVKASSEGPVVAGDLAIAVPPSSPPDTEILVDGLPVVQAARARVKQARASLYETRGRLLPALSASYSRGRSGPTDIMDGPFSWRDRTSLSWGAGASLSWPILSSGVISLPFAWTVASRQAAQASESARSTELSAAQDLQSAWSSYSAAADLTAVQDAYLKAADQRNREAEIRYTSGRISFDGWERMVNEYIDYKRSALRTRRDAVTAEAAWYQVLGRGLEEP